jgi:PhnB protein
VHLHLYAKNVDVMLKKAVAAGAKLLRPATDQFYGDRTGTVEDTFGHVWHIATHIRGVSKAGMRKAAAELAAGK